MKKWKSYLVVIMILFSAFSSYARKDILLDAGKKSAECSVEAFIDDSDTELTLVFNEDVGEVCVTIVSETGLAVFHEAINTTQQRARVYSLDLLSGGYYTILVSYEENKLSGKFNI